jgi:alpha,alpha-trehalose phosphorylase
MLHREPRTAPEYIYPVDPWRVVEKRFAPEFLGQTETLFALSNGYLGIRGAFEEGRPVVQSGTFVNGFHETWPIPYGEAAYGFATTGQTMLNVADAKLLKLYVDDEPFAPEHAHLLEFERVLDMRAGTLERRILWETPSGKRVSIRSTRLVSFEHRHLAAIDYEVSVLNDNAPLVIESEIRVPFNTSRQEGDPRKARGFAERVLEPREQRADGGRQLLGHRTHNSGMTIACGVDHVVHTDCEYDTRERCEEDGSQLVFSVRAARGRSFRLTKYLTYHTSHTDPARKLCDRAERTLDRAGRDGWEALLSSQWRFCDDFWQRSDVAIDGDARVQQSVRWNLFQLLQVSARVEGSGIGARGLTGQTYEGHYFWDTEIYVLPFLIYTAPRIARNLLRFRHGMLDKARERAREVGEDGALFPWRTITGEEASAYYAAGTAQYHINADVVYALRKYTEVSGDGNFLREFGAEMLVETARLWCTLGFFSEKQNGRFCIHAVTGPDEYNTVVNNNTFTNLMARENLRWAGHALLQLREDSPEDYSLVVDRTDLRDHEPEHWLEIAEAMYVPYDVSRGIHLQDDSFLDKQPWDFENTPADKYPLLLHYHPLVIYRHQVIKQADVVMAMFLLGHEFTRSQKRRNFDFYDPLTAGDSSLSACVQSIMASEIGYQDEAYRYFRYAVLMDLADIGGNVADGAHIAATGGAWMTLVYGFAGLRDHGGTVSFAPRLPEQWQGIRFRLQVRGRLLEVDLNHERATYRLLAGTPLQIRHQKRTLQLATEEPATVTIERRVRRPEASLEELIAAERFDAVLFDMDGVLTATAEVHAQAWKRTFDAYLAERAERSGEPFRPFEVSTDYLLYVDGKPRLDGVRDFLASRGIHLPEGDEDDPPSAETVAGIGNRKNAMVNEVLRSEGVQAYEGSRRVLEAVRAAGLKTAVVTSSTNCEATLAAAGLADLFDAQVDGNVAAAEDLEGKPAPDTYLAAAERLGTGADRAVVIEDAIAGVQAGREGGFGLVIGVARGANYEELAYHGADLVVRDLGELLPEPEDADTIGSDPR